MVACIKTVAFEGIEAVSVDVQVQISGGLPAFTIVGLPDKAVAESKERVRAAFHALGLSLPPKRLTVNLAPADILKEGTHYDLPIAVAMLVAMEILPADEMANSLVLGELGLDAGIRAVAGVLPAAVHASANDNRLICPAACGSEAAWAGKGDILAPQNLLQLINHVKGTQVMRRPEAKFAPHVNEDARRIPDLSEVRGQESAKRALEITAAGGHNLLMLGPPGSGKSMLASCLPAILPPLEPREALEVSMIHSMAGALPAGGLISARPYRDPHHSASQPALVGGGHKAKPGEISLAHRGVLFLDELPEFARGTLEALRQPLETGRTLIARANAHISYPASFQLIAAMNPCRCGYLGDSSRECTKAPRCGADYQAKISGPLLDRIDLQVEVPSVSALDMASAGTGETSAVIAARVARAREIQKQRYAAWTGEAAVAGAVNAGLPGAALDKLVPLEDEARATLTRAAETMRLSARAWHRILRVARTIADLGEAPEAIKKIHISEALSYRRFAVD